MEGVRWNSDLARSIDGLYATFSVYRKPSYTDPCLHCHTPDDEAKLRSKPLRELEKEELRDYAVDALLVWGDEQVFKHFLPRIYELYVTSNDPTLDFCDAEMILSKFRYGHWRNWPSEEQKAIEQFLHALWGSVLSDPPDKGSFTDVESWLCAVAQAEDDLSPYLQQWVDEYSQESCLALSSFLLTSAVVTSGKRGRNAFWDGRDAQYSQLQEWIKEPVVREKLVRARTISSDADLNEEFDAALAILA